MAWDPQQWLGETVCIIGPSSERQALSVQPVFGGGTFVEGNWENMHPVGRESTRMRVSAEMKKDYLPQHQDKTGGSWTVSESLAFLSLVLSVINLGIVCDRNKLPNHLIDGWVEGCVIVLLTFP